jgi:hypothetical protein
MIARTRSIMWMGFPVFSAPSRFLGEEIDSKVRYTNPHDKHHYT